ncbi:MAG: hypothetical protein WCK08_02265 [Betaproteobacteria bacterium]
MKSIKAILAALLISATAVIPAHAQFGGLGGMLGGGKPAAGGDVGTQVADFLKRSVVLSVLASNSLAKINAAFDNEEALARRRKEQEELSKITDPQEKQARAAKIYESERAESEKLAKSADLQDRMKNLDADKKKRIGEALFNFSIGALQAPALLQSGQNIMQGVGANPLNIAKVIPIKDALPLLGKVGSDAGTTIATFVKVAQGADISVPQAKADSKPSEETL